ncbi:hypothetical protein PG991_013297 [Apiospora marii]|uniref:Uncharacterized protein n=1 Tax=Apiospora marii TaxID=335849 RepID=A0ABR1R5J9_9PEZI
MQTYAAPPIATITGGGYEVPIASAVALLSEAPALLTRYTPPPGCATDWYWDTTVGAAPVVPSAAAAAAASGSESEGAEAQLSSLSSVIFSDRAHNGGGWATCQPYRVAARATYSAGVCPDRSAFMTVSKITKGPGPSDAFYLGACCATTATLSAYPGDNNNRNGGVLGATQYACVGTQESVVATRWLDDHRSVLERATGTVTAVADPLYMVWRESDLALHPESDANSLRAAMGMAAAASSSKAEPAPTATLTPEPKSRFPVGAIVGIVVAFVVCVLAISFLGFVAFSRRGKRWTERRRKNGSSDDHSDDLHGHEPPTRQLGGEEGPDGAFASVESHARSGPEPEGQGLKGPQMMQGSREIRGSPSTGDTSHFRDEFGEVEQKVLLNR